MTFLHKRLVGSLFLAVALGAMSAPALAQSYDDRPSNDRRSRDQEFRTPSGKRCAIGETNNGGSLSSSTVDDDETRRNMRNPRSCDDVGRY
jgi:hypothetical protein